VGVVQDVFGEAPEQHAAEAAAAVRAEQDQTGADLRRDVEDLGARVAGAQQRLDLQGRLRGGERVELFLRTRDPGAHHRVGQREADLGHTELGAADHVKQVKLRAELRCELRSELERARCAFAEVGRDENVAG
jgi:hypothetical protein